MSEEKKHCLIRIRSFYNTFNETEQKIADYILDDPHRIVNGTINEVADEIGIAVSTVFRFCKRIGFKGYQAMKIALAAELVEPIKDIHETILETDSEATITEKIFHSNMKTLEDTLKILPAEAMKEAVDLLLSARKIEIFGCGGSNVIAHDAYHKLIRTGLSVYTQSDTHMQTMSASQLKEEDVAILISHSGTTRDVLDILEILKKNNVKAIAITNFAKTTLSEQVQVILPTFSEETEYRSEALASRIAQLSIVDAIYVNVLFARKEAGKIALGKVRKAISSKRI
ncbi:MurR/RpiR family transcriptional regulator [Oceanobacillus halophilus]|uniref:MurR/RpiR family transcriptional regulator n=1 Tax=Oceanobacillus halophilus TaxID=930130 RepID=A0A495A8B8_9BACI|nr:MurR/RpiR family transcriptional regulator [Oceanobacillus halophilus]RKQ35641.1 MurR/RpiR family transcriptional regulator [Oceanobacillus halophilus]